MKKLIAYIKSKLKKKKVTLLALSIDGLTNNGIVTRFTQNGQLDTITRNK